MTCFRTKKCGYEAKGNPLSKPGIPLKAYEDLSAFKIYMADVGLLSAMMDLDVRTLLDGNRIFEEFKGSITEQYVLQQLVARQQPGIYYWSPENAKSEIDFLVQHEGEVVPIEAKAEENLKSKSLKVYFEKYKPAIAIRTSMSDYREEDWMINMPLYAINEVYQLNKV